MFKPARQLRREAGYRMNWLLTKTVLLKVLICFSFIFWLVMASSYTAHAFSKMIVFGDSLSDSGNIYAATLGEIPAPPYYDGRFTNGPNYADDLASNLGLNLKPYLKGGTSYAVGGAKTEGFPSGLPYDFLSQIDQFKLEIFLGLIDKPDKDAFYIVFIGSNNLREILNDALADPANQATIIQNGITDNISNIQDGLNSLRDEGAVNILVPNLPNVGRTPEFVSEGATSLGSSITSAFNEALDLMLDSFSDINIIRFDTYGLFEDVVNNPATYGFSNLDSACYTGDDNYTGGGTVCSEPDAHIFWDQIHPTAKAHLILANHIYTALIDNSWLNAGAVDIGNGWRWAEWFGYFYINNAPWIYHEQHHWLYQYGTSADSLVFWDEEMGAFWWTSASEYPYVYRFSDSSWLWYLKDSTSPRWFYNFTTDTWQSY